ncbi:MAG: type II toxin-antitoxin system VapC family toxin [Deltaproteobacteria bacterium]|nr:type II toxin-antitoxin system VapC family toxin [Deltaproteobacteria bacterium]
MSILLDTCGLLWWTLDPDQLSHEALKACEKMERGEGFVSSISLWELSIKVKNKKLDMGISIEKYVDKLYQLGYLKILPVDEKVWLKNLSLPWSHRDPADRTIVATAKIRNYGLVTSDKRIRKFYEKCIW